MHLPDRGPLPSRIKPPAQPRVSRRAHHAWGLRESDERKGSAQLTDTLDGSTLAPGDDPNSASAAPSAASPPRRQAAVAFVGPVWANACSGSPVGRVAIAIVNVHIAWSSRRGHMSVIVDLWNNNKYGFPDGRKRRLPPVALACIHITGNRNTAKNPEL